MPCANSTLSPAQQAVMQAIVAFGRTMGFTDAQIHIAVQVAFLESSLGVNLSNPASSASGLYHYTDGTWSDRHSDLGARTNNNSIVAFYLDLGSLQTRYDAGIANGDIPSGVDFGEYVYMRHHDGWNYNNFANSPGIAIFQSAPEFCIYSIPTNIDWYTASADAGDLDFGYWDNFYFMQIQDAFHRRVGIAVVGDPETVPLGLSAPSESPSDDFLIGGFDGDGFDGALSDLFGDGASHEPINDHSGRFDMLFLERPADFLDGDMDIARVQSENDFLFLASKFNGVADWLY